MPPGERPVLEVPYFKVKVCVVGEPAVGKTSLVRRHVFGDFDPTGKSSEGIQVTTRGGFVDLSEIGLTISKRRDAPRLGAIPPTVRVDLMFWDILGDTRPRKDVHRQQFSRAQGLLAVCDVTRAATLDALDVWIEEVYDAAGVIPTQLVANKADLSERAELKQLDILRAAWAYDSPYIFASAKTGENVDAAFQILAERVLLHVLMRRLERG